MNNIWQKFIKEFFSWSRGDRNAIIILSVLVILVLLVGQFLKTIDPKPVYSPEDFNRIVAEWEALQEAHSDSLPLLLFSFNPNKIIAEKLDSLALPQNIKRNILKYRAAGGVFFKKDDMRKLYGMNDSIFKIIEPYIIIEPRKKSISRKTEKKSNKVIPPLGTFDPNVADKYEMKKYGLSNYQVQNIIAYRAKGGSFKKKKDLLKIYGIDSLSYKKIEHYISISLKSGELKLLPKSILIELNTADTTDLIALNGIGSVFAKRIIKYRNLLGGFCNKKQLLEVYGMDNERFDGIKNNITVDSLKIKKLRINYADFSELLKHPYLNKRIVKAIMKEKEKNGPIKNISELKKIEGIDTDVVDKLTPYILCP